MRMDSALITSFVLAASLVPVCAESADCIGAARPYDCAVERVRQGDFAAAVEALEPLVRAHPDDLKSLNLLGIALTGAGRVPEANRAFEAALKASPRFYPAMKNLAVNQFNAGRFDRAAALLREVVKLAPNDAVSRIYLGEIAYRSHDCAEAIEQYQAAQSALPPEPALHSGECMLQRKDPTSAEANFAQLPADAYDLHFEAGIALARAGQDTSAAHHFGIARRGVKDPGSAVYNQMLCLIRAGEDKAAIEAGESFVDTTKSAELLNLLAEAYRKDNQLESAYNTLRTATTIDPTRIDNYIDLAILCQEHGNYALGLEITNFGMTKIPNSDRLYVQRGVLHAMAGEMDQARADFQKAAELAPARTLPVAALAACFLHDADYSSAIRLLRTEAPARKKDPMLWFLLGRALSAGGTADESEVIGALEKSVQLDPKYAPARAELGKALLKRGDVKRAVGELEASLKLDPNNRLATNQLMQGYRTLGNTQRVQELSAKLRTILTADRDSELRMAMQHIVRLDKDENAAPVASR